MIQYGSQNIDNSDKEAVLAVLNSDFLTQGPEIHLFESALSNYCSVKHAIAVSSATAALHISYLALGLKPGDIVWTSPNTFVATANAALYSGAKLDFVDIDPNTGNMSTESLAEKLLEAERNNTLPSIIVPVHFAGQSCDMKAINELCKKYDISIVEDASHALGASYKDSMVGSCKYSDLSVFSFHPVKMITTGEGGAITTNNSELQHKLNLLRSHGIERSDDISENHGPWYYEQTSLGFNYRLSDIQAALGRSQLKRLDSFVSHRNQLAERYMMKLDSNSLTPLSVYEYGKSSYHIFVAKLDNTNLKRKDVFNALYNKGIGTNVHYIPIYWQPFYQSLGFKKGHCPQAEAYYHSAITLPLHTKLENKDVDNISTTLNIILQHGE